MLPGRPECACAILGLGSAQVAHTDPDAGRKNISEALEMFRCMPGEHDRKLYCIQTLARAYIYGTG